MARNELERSDAPLTQNRHSNEWHQRAIKFLVGATMVVLYLWIAGGLFNISKLLWPNFGEGWAKAAEKMIVDAVIILAVLELIRTLQSYLSLGRVRVTFILDAALVVLIGELIGLSFLNYSAQDVLLHLAVIGALGMLRLLTARISPHDEEGEL